MKQRLIGGGIAALIVVLWIYWGRFAVEGGKVPWAIINDRSDVLKAALAAGASQDEREEGLWRAVHKSNPDAVRMIVATGIDPNKVKIGDNQLLDYPATTFATQKALLESGADPRKSPGGGAHFILSLVRSYGKAASEGELIALVAELQKKGLPIEPAAVESAESQKLEKLAAYLRDPAGTAPVGKVQKLALRGGDDAIEWKDLKAVCTGDGVAALPPYQKEPDAVSPAYLFELQSDEPRNQASLLPRWWIADRLSHTQVVGCARVVEKHASGECKYQGGVTVTYYSATYQLSVREAKTGKELAQKTVSLEQKAPEKCSMFKMGGSESVYPEFAPEMLPLIQAVIGAE